MLTFYIVILNSHSVLSDNNSTNVITNQTGQNLTQNPNVSSLSIETDRSRYIPGEFVIIDGTVQATEGEKKITIEIYSIDKNKVVYKTSMFSSGYYSQTIKIGEAGKYNVTASIDPDGNPQAWTNFEVTELYYTSAAFIMYLGLASFAGLMIVIAKATSMDQSLRELLRFVFITIIAFVPIGVFILTDVEIGGIAPVGLISKLTNEVNKTNPVVMIPTWNWVINIGGAPADSYIGGIQIPVFVFIFGLAGGYIRYLYMTFAGKSTADKQSQSNSSGTSRSNEKNKAEKGLEVDSENDKKSWDKGERLQVFYDSLSDLAYLFLSPLLAIASYFLLLQAGVNTANLPTIATVCFAVGLVTRQVVEKLEQVVTGAISPSPLLK